MDDLRDPLLWNPPDDKRTEAQWIGLRESLQETMDFPMKYGGFKGSFRYFEMIRVVMVEDI